MRRLMKSLKVNMLNKNSNESMNKKLENLNREEFIKLYHAWVVDCIMDAFVYPVIYLASLVGLALLVEKVWLK
jgi:hypothetical protein